MSELSEVLQDVAERTYAQIKAAVGAGPATFTVLSAMMGMSIIERFGPEGVEIALKTADSSLRKMTAMLLAAETKH